MNTKLTLLVLPAIISFFSCKQKESFPFLNTELSVDERVQDLVSRLTLQEKVSQMSHLAPAIERLGIQAYGPILRNPLSEESWWDEEEIEEMELTRPWEDWEEFEEGDCLDGGWWNEALHGVARAGAR